MTYHEKTPTLHEGRANPPGIYPPSRPAATQEVNHRAIPRKAHAVVRPLSLFDKVRNFGTAKQLRAAGVYPYFRTISSAQDT